MSAAVATIHEVEAEFLSNLELLDDRLLQYEYLLSYIDDLDELSAEECTDVAVVEGCVSKAWMQMSVQDGVVHVRMNADALLIKGLLGVVTTLVQDRSCVEVGEWVPVFLEHPQLKPQLNIDRRQGMRAVVEQIQALAQASAPTFR